MTNIISSTDVNRPLEKLHAEKKHIVLVGGCFDIIHIGHITFLQEAKKQGDTLVVLLESDATIRKMKGPKRPINAQQDRAIVLAAFKMVDYIILLKPNLTNHDYDRLVTAIKPAIIATTAGDSSKIHKERQAKIIGAQVVDVTKPVKDQSTTRLFGILSEI